MTRLPWIPGEQQWLDILQVARREPTRNRVTLALAHDAALRRGELCSLQTDDLDPAGASGAVLGALLAAYLAHWSGIGRTRGPLFLSESRRNHAQPLTLWTWSKVVRQIELAAGIPQFSTNILHLCVTDLARMGWEAHTIAAFAGHRHMDSTLAYVHLSGRDLADKLSSGMDHVHAWRICMLTSDGEP